MSIARHARVEIRIEPDIDLRGPLGEGIGIHRLGNEGKAMRVRVLYRQVTHLACVADASRAARGDVVGFDIRATGAGA